jgi:hypothetical protein
MTNFNRLPHSITAALGALIVSTTFIAAAVGPAAANPAPVVASVQTSAQAHA